MYKQPVPADLRSRVLLPCLVAMLSVAAILLMVMPFLLVRRARQYQNAPVPQLLSDPPGPG